jgi:hypothetical protein
MTLLIWPPHLTVSVCRKRGLFVGAATSKACYGAACFRPTALVGCALSVAAVCSAVLLVCRTSSHYRKLWAPNEGANERRSRPYNYTRELAAQREEDYRKLAAQREEASRELQQRRY